MTKLLIRFLWRLPYNQHLKYVGSLVGLSPAPDESPSQFKQRMLLALLVGRHDRGEALWPSPIAIPYL